jgi:hypothetical protein
MCKRYCKQGFHLSEHFQKTLHCEKDKRIQVPCQPSGRLSVHYSIRLDNVSFRPDSRQICIIRPNDVFLPSGHIHCIEKLLFQLASVWKFQQHVRTPLGSQTVSDSFQVPRKGRSINRPDDVVSRLDACLLKARIAIQISPSGRLTALVRTRMQCIWKLPIRLQPSEHLPLMVRTHAL